MTDGINLIHNKYKLFILERINIDNNTQCWNWCNYKNPKGYGMVKINKVVKLAHRISWEIWNNTIIPDNLYACHTCDNTSCCNPEHIFLGTQKDNVSDMFSKNRNHYTRGEYNGRTKLNNDQVNQIIDKYNSGNYTQQELGDVYNVNQRTISAIICKTNWKELK